LRGPFQELHERLAVLGDADALLRHLSAGGVVRGTDLEQLCHRLGRPHDIKVPQRLGIIVAGEGRNAPTEEAMQGRAGTGGVAGFERMAGDAGAKYLSTLQRIDLTLARWASGKFKSLRGHKRRSRHWLARIARHQPRLFAHWGLLYGRGRTMGAG